MLGPGSSRSCSESGTRPFRGLVRFFPSILAPTAVRFRIVERRKGRAMNEGDLFIAAVQIHNLAERSAYLEQVCGDDIALRERVEALLKASDQAGSFLQQPAA